MQLVSAAAIQDPRSQSSAASMFRVGLHPNHCCLVQVHGLKLEESDVSGALVIISHGEIQTTSP